MKHILKTESIDKLCEIYHIGKIKAIIVMLKCQNINIAIEYLHLKKLEKYDRKKGFYWIDNTTGNAITDKEILRMAKRNVIAIQHSFGRYVY